MELDMLAKTVLCPPPRARRKHERAVAAFTIDRVDRWKAGERLSFWEAAPTLRSKQSERDDEESKRHQAVQLAREGLDGKACAALRNEQLLPANTKIYRLLKALHPESAAPMYPPATGLANAPQVDRDTILRAVWSFPR